MKPKCHSFKLLISIATFFLNFSLMNEKREGMIEKKEKGGKKKGRKFIVKLKEDFI